MVTSNKIKGKLLTLKRLKNMATENGWSGYSVAPVTIIVSQSIDGQTLTANITGNTTGGTYANNKITWDNLTAMNFSGYAYDSTRTDNFE